MKTKSTQNKQGWKLGKDIETPQNNQDLFVVLVDLRPDGSTDFYVYEYNSLARKIKQLYNEYIQTPKRDGKQRKEVGFRWFDLKYFQEDDKSRKNKWNLISTKLKQV